MKKSVFFLLIMSLFVTNNAFSSGFNEEINIDQLEQLAKKEKVKKEKQPKDSIRRGWTFGVLPSIAYDAD